MSEPSRTEPLILRAQMSFLGAIARLHILNPFEPAFEEQVKVALGEHYVPGEGVGCSRQGVPSQNLQRLEGAVAMALVPIAQSLANGVTGTERERKVYQGAAIFGLWQEFGTRLQGLIKNDEVEVAFYDAFVESYRFFFGHPRFSVPEPAHLFSLLYQARRAWYYIWTKIRGRSPSVAAVRAALYRASLAGEPCAYANGLYLYLDKVAVLLTGETGTGKEEAATCIGWSRYVPIDPKTRRLATPYKADFHVRNIAACAKELIESELFGHKRGSFTGAVSDKAGCFDMPKQHGTLFLDEIGDLELHLQVKLLRPLENRESQAIGETRPHPIHGRPVCATNKNLAQMCREGKFREDLYHRLNGVRIHLPTLRQMRAEVPDELHHYAKIFAEEILGDPAQADVWAERVAGAIDAAGPAYDWPGNLRELKKLTEAFIVSGGNMQAREEATAVPPRAPAPSPETRSTPMAEGKGAPESTCQPSSGLVGANAKAGQVDAKELIVAFVHHVYVETGQNLSETARRTGFDRKTVRQMLDPARVARLLAQKAKKPGEE